jgi:hypothetical protein
VRAGALLLANLAIAATGCNAAKKGLKEGALRAANRPAWVISMENVDSVRSKYCLYLWGKFIAFQPTKVTYAVAPCPGSDGV